jgi:hypothetical protein
MYFAVFFLGLWIGAAMMKPQETHPGFRYTVSKDGT